jgi:lipopolysaccharide biosynthesis protein
MIMDDKAKNTKLIAYYLPQFHEIEENNKWWGKGFTEWNNTKKARPLYHGHYQPKIPLHENYYDLADSKVMEMQSQTAKKYGIYGFCFYHYWFGGKKLLEKPVEDLLNNLGIDINFCLMWANEPWTRTWNGVAGSKNILIDQEYGSENEWKEHFLYLLPFFKDHRYICHKGNPVFLIYKAIDIPNCNAMLEYWNALSLQYGFNGIHFIQADTAKGYDKKSKMFDAVVEFEPRKSVSEIIDIRWSSSIRNLVYPLRKLPLIARHYYLQRNYDEIYKNILERKYKRISKKVYMGAFVDWDNTARRGADGEVFYGASPQKFEAYMTKLIELSNKAENDFLFINAWNEWAEGAYLEPDEKYGYAYLHAIRRALRNNK